MRAEHRPAPKISGRRIARASLACLLAALPPGLCFGADSDDTPLQEIVVTATRRDTKLLETPISMTVIGGETFAGVCRVLKATRLSVEGEFLHGVPASRMESGLWSGTFCASKSGAFGEPDWLLEHLNQRS